MWSTRRWSISSPTIPEALTEQLPGHDTGDAASEDLLASPQFVMDSAYTTLRDRTLPDTASVSPAVRKSPPLFQQIRGPAASGDGATAQDRRFRARRNPYGWRDILMEEIGLSRAEHEILTDSAAVHLWRMYGFPNGTAMETRTSSATIFPMQSCSPAASASLTTTSSHSQTRFVNPNSDLIPKLERLGVNFATLAELKTKNDASTDKNFDDFLAAMAVPPDPAEYGGDPNAPKTDYTPIRNWVKNDANYGRIMGLITLAIPASPWSALKAHALRDFARPTLPPSGSTLYYECTTAGTSAATEPKWPNNPGDPVNDGTVVWTCRDASSCSSFGNLAFRYSDPSKTTQNISTPEFVRLLRFIRLWKKLGWTIEQTDAAVCALTARIWRRSGPATLTISRSWTPGF